MVDGVERPVMFVSRVLTSSEVNYSPTEGEALAIVFVLRRCEHLLYGQQLLIRTDHRPLTFIRGGNEANRKLARWWSILQEFDYQIEYVQGKANVVADALSRLAKSDVVYENETLELHANIVYAVPTTTDVACDFCDDEYELCDLCGEKTCLICKLGSPP